MGRGGALDKVDRHLFGLRQLPDPWTLGGSPYKAECVSGVGVSQGPAPPAATSLEGGRRGDGASFSLPPPPSATTASVTKWQLGARLASKRHIAGDCRPCTPRMPGHPRARTPNGLAVQMARADWPTDPSGSRVPGPPRPLQTRSPGPRLRASAGPVRARAPTAGRHGPRGARSAAAVGEGWASGAPGNMAARPSTAASRPPVLEKRLGREVAEGVCVEGGGLWGGRFPGTICLPKTFI